MTKVSLHVRTEPHEEDHGDGVVDCVRVIGEVKRGEQILHSEESFASNTVESVDSAKEKTGLEIELWAVQNTDFEPTADALPA